MARRRSIRSTFAFALGLAAAASLTLAAGGMLELLRIRRFVEADLGRMAMVPRIGEELQSAQVAGSRYLFSGSLDDLKALDTQADHCVSELHSLAQLADDAQSRTNVDTLGEWVVRYKKSIEYLGGVNAGQFKATSPERQQEFEQKKNDAEYEISQLSRQLFSVANQRSDERLRQVRHDFARLLAVFAFVVGVLILCFALAWRSGGRLVERVVALIESIRSITADTKDGRSASRFDVRLPVRGADELRDLAVAFNAMLEAQQLTVGRLVELFHHVTDAASRIDGVMREVTSGAAEQHRGAGVATQVVEQVTQRLQLNAGTVASAVEDAGEGVRVALLISDASRAMAGQAKEAKAAVDETGGSVDQLARSVEQVTSRAGELSTAAETTTNVLGRVGKAIREVQEGTLETARLVGKVAEQAAAGADVMRKNIEGIGRIHDEASLVANVVGSLAERVERIGQVVAVIEGVADQTSLLALNASIIAASAGEAGRGFAVVAEEIKELAGRTRVSTGEIADVVRAIQSGTQEVLEASKRSASAVDEGVKLAEDAANSLTAILGSARGTQELTTQMARSTEEQVRSAAQVRDSVRDVSTAAQSIAEATRGQASDAQQIRRNVGKLRQVMLLVEQRSGEQEAAARQVASVIEGIARSMGQIERAHGEQASANSRVLSSVQRIVDVAQRYQGLVTTLRDAVGELGRGTGWIEDEVGQLKLTPPPAVREGSDTAAPVFKPREPSARRESSSVGKSSAAERPRRLSSSAGVPRVAAPHEKTPRIAGQDSEAVPEHVPWEHTPPLVGD